jgi:hypothetical protein
MGGFLVTLHTTCAVSVGGCYIKLHGYMWFYAGDTKRCDAGVLLAGDCKSPLQHSFELNNLALPT